MGKIILTLTVTAMVLAASLCPAGQTDSGKKKKNYAVAPILVSNPAIGNGAGVTGMYFFDIGEGGPDQPRSSLQAVGGYTDTHSYFAGLLSSLYFNNDRIRVNAGAFGARINNEYRDPRPGRDDAEFATKLGAFFAQLRYRSFKNLFVGLQFKTVDTRFDPDNQSSKEYLEFVGAENTTTAGIGPLITYDSRDNPHYPYSGTLAEISMFSNPEGWGNDETYHTFEGVWNRYQQIVPRHILALRVLGRTGTEDTPYSDKSRLGMRSDLRGFKAGEIVGRTLLSGQAEYRWQFLPRWGAVGFAGLADLWDDDIESTITEDLYYSGGVGLRYMINTDERINLRIDVAVGNGENSGLYVGIREAF